MREFIDSQEGLGFSKKKKGMGQMSLGPSKASGGGGPIGPIGPRGGGAGGAGGGEPVPRPRPPTIQIEFTPKCDKHGEIRQLPNGKWQECVFGEWMDHTPPSPEYIFNEDECEMYGHYWWSNYTCHDEAEPEPEPDEWGGGYDSGGGGGGYDDWVPPPDYDDDVTPPEPVGFDEPQVIYIYEVCTFKGRMISYFSPILIDNSMNNAMMTGMLGEPDEAEALIKSFVEEEKDQGRTVKYTAGFTEGFVRDIQSKMKETKTMYGDEVRVQFVEIYPTNKYEPLPLPEFKAEEEEEKKEEAWSPCFIATACYGQPDAPEIDVLRDFRDERLETNSVGRAMVKTYYTISPPIANFIAKSEPLKAMVRKVLNPIVNRLKK